MRIHYYSGWFDDALPEQMIEMLRADLACRKSLAIVWGCWALEEYVGYVKEWFDPAGIIFEEYHAIDPRMPKEEAQELVKNASAVLMMGGETEPMLDFIIEYGLDVSIRESKADVIMGYSAGAINMGTKWVCSKNNRYDVEETKIIDGIGLDNFCFQPYFETNNIPLIENDLLPLSQELDIYALTAESFMRVKSGEVAIVGEGYLVSDAKIRKMET